MPQMSPMNWLCLYVYTLFILLIVNVMLNYLYLIDFSTKSIKMNNTNLIFYKWMW